MFTNLARNFLAGRKRDRKRSHHIDGGPTTTGVADKLRVVTSGHVTKMAVTPFDTPYPKNLHATRKPRGSVCYEPELWAIKVYVAGISIFDFFCSCDLDLDPMTFICKRDPCSLDVQIWNSYVNAAQTYMHTYRHTDKQTDRQTYRHTESNGVINYAASRVVKNYFFLQMCIDDAVQVVVVCVTTQETSHRSVVRGWRDRQLRKDCGSSSTVKRMRRRLIQEQGSKSDFCLTESFQTMFRFLLSADRTRTLLCMKDTSSIDLINW